MSVKKMNFLFKLIILLLGISGFSLLLILGPKIGSFLNDGQNGNIIQLLLWITAIPVLFILVSLWRISSDLLNETIFSKKNSQRLIKIAYSGVVESVIYGVALMIGLFNYQGNYPYFFICVIFFFLGLIIAVIASLLAYIFRLAGQLKNENDLTI